MSQARAPIFRALPLVARFYIAASLGFALLAVAAETGFHPGPDIDPGLFAVAAALCAVGNLFEVFAPASFSFQPNLIVFFAASVLLPPWAVAALAVASFLPGWFTHRFRWYMVAFNIANYTLAGMAAHAVVSLDGPLGGSPDVLEAFTLAIAALAFVLVNHALIVAVVTLTRARPLRQSASDMFGCFPMDLALTMTGACLAALWVTSRPLTLLCAGPIALIYRALWVPLLEHRSRTDPKTGLYNSSYLTNELEGALASAQRGGLGLSVMMIDLDHLRLVNNRHGHLAGDQVIQSVAEIVREAAERHGGLGARFGGDELCMLLPGTSLEQGREIAEGIRAAVAAVGISFEDEIEPITITISTGIAAFPEHSDTVDGLLGAADAAVYDAKLGGRNRTRIALPAAARDALERPAPTSSAPAITAELARNANAPEPTFDLGLDGASSDPVPAPGPAPAAAASSLRIKLYVGLLLAIATVIGLLSDHAGIQASPWLFGLLVASVVALDSVRIDVFERANLSPAAVPELALAYFFGPLGPIAAEAVIALTRLARRDPMLKAGFDLGALSLAGATAALTFDLFPGASGGALIIVGALAGTVYFAVNSALLAIVMALAEGRGPVGVWRERLAWMTPHYVVFGLLAGTFVISELGLGLSALAVFGLPVLMLWIAEKQYLDRSRATVTELRATNDELEAANSRLRGLLDDNQRLLGRMHRSYISTITSLARTVEAKDPMTSGHTERVADIAVMLAAQLGFDEAQLPAIKVGAIIHDIGKIAIPDAILLKAGPLSPEEMETMRSHPEMSSYIIAELELPAVVKQMVRSHHERFDGSGYPDRLIGEEIPLAARILSVADALDAMISDRPYRKALPLEAAREEIASKAGTQFCPHVVAALLAAVDSEPGFWGSIDASATDPELLAPPIAEAGRRSNGVPEAEPHPVSA